MTAIPRRWHGGPWQKALGLTAAFAGGLGFLPLFGGPGYEAAVAQGLVLPSILAVSVAHLGPASSPRRGVLRGLWRGLVVYVLATAISLLHLLHAPRCAVGEGMVYSLLTAGIGCLLAGVWGALVAELWRPRRGRTLLALAAPLGCIALGLLRFYRSPMVFAYDPFVGYFSGTLYDTVIEPGAELYTYRFGSALSVLGVLGVSCMFVREAGERGRLRVQLGRGGLAWGCLGALALFGSAYQALSGARFGHAYDAEEVAEALGGQKQGARCTVSHPRTLSPREAALLLRDCEEQLGEVEAVLGARGAERVHAFFFRDADEKKRLMGAANTYIAKPWRHEVYLQLASYPHPVLGHELAHVVAGSFGRGPFRIAGRLGGLLPDPGLVEGVATAASPHDDTLTPLQWSRAMKDAGILPALDGLFSLEFMLHASSRAYTVSGAFVQHLIDTHGAELVRAWYGGGDLPDLTGKSWAALELDFHAALDRLPMTDEAARYAKAKFDKPGLFARRCPHLLDRLRGEGERCLRDGDLDGAQRRLERVLGDDPHDARANLAWAELARAQGNPGEAEARYLRLIEQGTALLQDRARESLADLQFSQGRYAEAEQLYAYIARETQDDDLARSGEVKAMAVRDPLLRAPALALLVGVGPDAKRESLLAGALLGEVSDASERSRALSGYLLGKNLVTRGVPEEAASYLLHAAEGFEVLGPRTRRELAVQLAVAACLTRQPTLQRLAWQHTALATPAAQRLLQRCGPPMGAEPPPAVVP